MENNNQKSRYRKCVDKLKSLFNYKYDSEIDELENRLKTESPFPEPKMHREERFSEDLATSEMCRIASEFYPADC